METFYLIDFENVHNDGLENIDLLSKEDHVHIFYTKNAQNIKMDIVFSKGIDIQGHSVPAGDQSLDKHLVSYLGYLLGMYGKQCNYVIVSKDTGYKDIIKFWKEFWKEEGDLNISQKEKICEAASEKKESPQTQTINEKINAGMARHFSGDDRNELNIFMQRGLISKGYSGSDANKICKYVVARCNDEQMLKSIHNDLRTKVENSPKAYEDVKVILSKFVDSKSKVAKRESQVRSFFGQHFREKRYVDKKEKIISIILNARTKQQVNNDLTQLYSDGDVLKHIHKTIKPLIKDLPGR